MVVGVPRRLELDLAPRAVSASSSRPWPSWLSSTAPIRPCPCASTTSRTRIAPSMPSARASARVVLAGVEVAVVAPGHRAGLDRRDRDRRRPARRRYRSPTLARCRRRRRRGRCGRSSACRAPPRPRSRRARCRPSCTTCVAAGRHRHVGLGRRRGLGRGADRARRGAWRACGRGARLRRSAPASGTGGSGTAAAVAAAGSPAARCRRARRAAPASGCRWMGDDDRVARGHGDDQVDRERAGDGEHERRVPAHAASVAATRQRPLVLERDRGDAGLLDEIDRVHHAAVRALAIAGDDRLGLRRSSRRSP